MTRPGAISALLGRVLPLVLGTTVAAATLVGLWAHHLERKEDWRSAAGRMAYEVVSPSDPVFFVHFGGQLAFDRYFSGPQPRVGLPENFGWEQGLQARYRVTAGDVERRAGPALLAARQAFAVLTHDEGRGREHLLAYLDRWGVRVADVDFSGVRIVHYVRRV